MRNLLIITIMVSALCSCKKSTGPAGECLVACYHARISAYFTGYSLSDLDSVITKEYKNDGTFSTLISEQVFNRPDSISPIDGTPGLDLRILLDVGYDYEIIIPSTFQTFVVSAITDTGYSKYLSCDHPGSCVSTLTNVSVSGGKYRVFSNAMAIEGIYYVALGN